MAFLVVLLTTAAVVPLGAQVLALTRLGPREVPERFLSAAALGYVLLAYAVLALGYFGLLTPRWIAVVLAVFAVAGIGNWDLLWEALLRFLSAALRALRTRDHVVGAALLLLVLAATLITALEPPTSRDFDGLAEHLAQARTYVRHHQIEPLWFDHHSHFPATMEMLYVVGLSFGSVSGAKLFHWFHGLMAVMAVILITRRHLARRAGAWAGYVLASTPMFLWLSGIAYVDLGVMAYGLLAVLAYLRWRAEGRTADLLLAGLLAGCAMTVKMQGLALGGVLVLAAAVVALRRLPADAGQTAPPARARGLGLVAASGLLAVLIACPWYLRTYVNTGNPFYPFAYGVFGGKHWSADRAAGYDRHQLAFGLGEMPSPEAMAALPRWRQKLVGPREPWKWLVAPIALTFLPWQFEVKLGNLQNILLTATGPLYLALIAVLALMPRRPAAVSRLLWLFAPLWLWWFWSMQLARYLFPTLAMLAPVAGYAAYRCARGGMMLSRCFTAALVLWSVLVAYTAVSLAAPALPVVLGLKPVDEYLLANTDVYVPSYYIAHNLPPEARVCTYGEVRCFYFDRDYFWGEPGHSDLIPYDGMGGAEDLIRSYREYGITHVLINQAYLPGLWDSQDKPFVLLRQAMDKGLLTPVTDFPTRRQFLLYAVRSPATAGGSS
jgi:hypothetical protein